MTGQINDEFLYQEEAYAIAGIDGSELFDPEEVQMQTIPASTACWRGFQAFYMIKDDKLVLHHLNYSAKEPVTINNKKPIKGEFMFKYQIPELDLLIDFTGTILIAKDFIQEMYVHMGFQRPTTYRTVLELRFNNGVLAEVKDLSDEMARRRERNPDEGAQPKSPYDKDVKSWIEETFSLDYKKDEESEE